MVGSKVSEDKGRRAERVRGATIIEVAILLFLVMLVGSYGLRSSGSHVHCALKYASITMAPPPASAEEARALADGPIDCSAIRQMPAFPTPGRLTGNNRK